jgi:hypothetical protein
MGHGWDFSTGRSHEGAVKKLAKRPLSIPDILRWADFYREANGRWPTKDSGTIVQAPFETWARVDAALRTGTRGLDGSSSLAQLLAQKRGARNIQDLPPLTEAQILAWADAHHERTGAWPTRTTSAPARPSTGGASTTPCSRGCAACRAALPWPGCCTGTEASATARRSPR